MTFALATVDVVRAQLDRVMTAAGWHLSFADHESVQHCPPFADNVTNHLHPFLAPTIDWHAGDPDHVEATDFDAKLHRAANVFDLMPWLARQALDARMSQGQAIVAAHGLNGRGGQRSRAGQRT